MHALVTLLALATSHAAPLLAAPSAEAAEATKHCVVPTGPKNRSQCGSAGSDSFILQLALCGHKHTDGMYLIPTTNMTTGIASVYTSASPPSSQDQYEYPSSFSVGPWAWSGEFAFSTSVSSAPDGVNAIVFGGSSGSEFSCQLTEDGVKFDCGGVAQWYVNGKNGSLFSDTSSVKAKGFQKVVPYIFQGCGSS